MKTKLLVFFLLFSLETGVACSCIYISDFFCETQAWFPDNYEHQIARVKILNFYDHYMDVVVTEQIKGPTLPDTLKIVGQDGFNCNYWLEDFAVAQELIVAIQGSNFESTGYDLSGCGRYFLEVEGETVIGPVREGIINQDYQDFKAGIDECLLSTATSSLTGKGVQVFPNPARDQLNIVLPNASRETTLLLFYADGKPAVERTIRQESTSSSRIFLDLQGLPPGIYWLSIRRAGVAVGYEKVVIF